jgi:hypothetical protein
MKIDLNNIHLFDWGELYYVELETEIGLDSLQVLNVSQEKTLINQSKEFKKKVEENEGLNSLSEEDRNSYYDHFFERDYMIMNELKILQRYSMILSLFSFFEGRLKSICELIENQFSFKIKINDLNSNEDLLKYWNFLSKVFEIETKPIESVFTPIKQQKIIRNIIAHQQGLARENQVKKIVIKKGLELDNLRLLITDVDFIKNLIYDMQTFYKKLLIEIDKRYKILDC